MDKFSLQKAQSIINFWNELTLTEEAREKRVREKADKAAQEFHEKLFGGKIKKEEIKLDKTSNNQDNQNKGQSPRPKHSDPKSLDRFLNLGLAPDMMKPPSPQTKQTSTNQGDSKENG